MTNHPPPQPSLHILDNSSLQLSWSSVSGADRYGVIVHDGETKYLDWPSKSLCVNGSEATAGSGTSVFIEGLRPGTAYKAKVAARHDGTWSSYSEFTAEVTLPLPVVPQVPSLQRVNCSTMRVSWAEVPGAGLYGVVVNDGNKSSYYDWSTESLVSAGAGAEPGLGTSVLVSGLRPGVSYKAKVCARSGSTWSEYSAFSAKLILPRPAKPGAPVLHAADSTTLQLSWSAVAGAERYGVIMHEDGEIKYLDWSTARLVASGQDATSGKETFVKLKGARPRTPYRAKVAAKQDAVWSEYSDFSAEVMLTAPPSVPLLERVNDSMLVVSWSEITGAERYDVILHDGKTHHANWQTNALQASLSNTQGKATSLPVKGLRADLPYRAKVAAFLDGQWAEYSEYSAAIYLGRASSDRKQSRKRGREEECAVCWSRPAQVALDPCGHLCACPTCADKLDRCPICRGSIDKRLRVYPS